MNIEFLKQIEEKILANRWIDEFHAYNGTHCWRFAGAHAEGYGIVQFNRESYKVHRVFAAIYKGLQIENSDVLVCHHCDIEDCFNPGHLFLGSHLDNMQDRARKGRHPNSLKTHCPKGHRLLGVNNLGRRYCKECDNIAAKLRYQIKKEAQNNLLIQ